VIDCFSRAIVGWHATQVKNTAMVATAPKMALWRRDHDGRRIDVGLVHHSDARSQYTSIAFAEPLRDQPGDLQQRLNPDLKILGIPGSVAGREGHLVEQTLSLEGVAASIGSVGDAYDNALAESTTGLFKTEVISRNSPFRVHRARRLMTSSTPPWNGSTVTTTGDCTAPSATSRPKSSKPLTTLNQRSSNRNRHQHEAGNEPETV
jgi:transposase InsO family protein